jgi:hypothetical protein
MTKLKAGGADGKAASAIVGERKPWQHATTAN